MRLAAGHTEGLRRGLNDGVVYWSEDRALNLLTAVANRNGAPTPGRVFSSRNRLRELSGEHRHLEPAWIRHLYDHLHGCTIETGHHRRTGQSGPQAGQEQRKTARPATTPVKVDRETALRLLQQGPSTRQIARELDISRTTLLRLLEGL